MIHLLYVPHVPLLRHIECFWYVEHRLPAPELQARLPEGVLELVLNLADAQWLCHGEQAKQRDPWRETWIAGQQQSPLVIASTGHVRLYGIRFRPGGALAFTGVSCHELTSAVVPLDTLWRGFAGEVRERLAEAPTPRAGFQRLEQLLRRNFGPRLHADRRLEMALRTLASAETPPRIAALATSLGMSRKHLDRLFDRHVGLSPSSYRRIARLQRAITLAERHPQGNWARIALDSGYHDQSHLIHDFRDLANMTPEQYRLARSEHAAYVDLAG